MARYTFFEVATQKGYLLEVFHMLLPHHWERQPWGAINSDEIGLVAKPQGEETILLDFRTTGRQPTESNQIWRERVRAEAEAAWEVVRKKREEYARKLREDTLAAEAASRAEANAEKAGRSVEEGSVKEGPHGGPEGRLRVRNAPQDGVDPAETKEGEGVKVKAAKTAKVKSDKSESVPSPRSAAN